MVIDLFPRAHARFTCLPLLGPHLDGFVEWLSAHGYPETPIQRRVRKAPLLDARLRRRGVRDVSALSRAELLRFAPSDSESDVYLGTLVRSLTSYFEEREVLALPAATPRERLVGAYGDHLRQVRGLADSTVTHHCATATELLGLVGFDGDHEVLRQLQAHHVEAFVKSVSPRHCRASLQHTVAHLRSFLRFLAGRGDVPRGLDSSIDTPRVYRGEMLPRSLPWETVEAFLGAIDRTTSMGRRDYAMFLLITTYGLRASEVVALRLDDIEWGAERLRAPRPKTRTPIVLPLTQEVGAAIIDYLRHARPELAHREVFLRVRAPAGPLAATAVTEAFQRWSRRSGLSIPYQGPHCLRHSLAVHLLRQGTSLKAIGDLLGHRSAESTCVYLRLHVDDLRDAALDLPADEEVCP
jgi:integrase/recombinase XerD